MTLNELLAMQGGVFDPNVHYEAEMGGSAPFMPSVGQGWMAGLANLPGQAFMDPMTGDFDQNAFLQYLRANNLTAAEGQPGGAQSLRGIFDAQGNPVIPVETGVYEDDNFWTAAMLAAAVTGANVGLASGGFGGAGGASGGAAGAGGAGSALTGTNALAGGAAGAAGGAAGGAGAAAGAAGAASIPSWVGPAVNAGIGLIGQNQAMRAAEQGSQAQIDLLREVNAQNRADNAPLLAMRNSVLPQINALISNPSSITQDPGYQFGLDQGNRQIANRQAASGNYYSGGALREAQRFGQDYAGSRLDQSLNRLMGVAGLGQVGGNNQQQANTNFGNVAGNALMNQGANRASGYMGMTNNVGGAVNDWFNNWQRNALGGP